jgi:hypothetical protein
VCRRNNHTAFCCKERCEILLKTFSVVTRAGESDQHAIDFQDGLPNVDARVTIAQRMANGLSALVQQGLMCKGDGLRFAPTFRCLESDYRFTHLAFSSMGEPENTL